MAIIRGEQGSVQFETGSGSLAVVAGTKSWSLSVEKDALETTAHGATFKSFVGGLIGGSGSVELVFDEGVASQKTFIDDVLKANDGADASFELFQEGSTGNQNSYTFGGVVTNAEMTSAVGELVTVSASFQTSGTIASN